MCFVITSAVMVSGRNSSCVDELFLKQHSLLVLVLHYYNIENKFDLQKCE